MKRNRQARNLVQQILLKISPHNMRALMRHRRKKIILVALLRKSKAPVTLAAKTIS